MEGLKVSSILILNPSLTHRQIIIKLSINFISEVKET